jgi:hypothetical protein
MGRPSKLTDSQWEDLLRRLALGETAADLARKYRISPTSISKRVSQQAEDSKTLAVELVKVESAIKSKPVSQQRVIRSIADRLQVMSEDYAEAAQDGVETAKHLQAMSKAQAKALPPDATVEDLRPIAALAETANKSAAMASNLIAANKPEKQGPAGGLESIIDGSWGEK